jgi:hypothetical protein
MLGRLLNVQTDLKPGQAKKSRANQAENDMIEGG